MNELTSRNFGLLIAYLLPGLLVLYSLSGHLPVVSAWLGTPPAEAPTVGGFFYATLASLAAGMTVSSIRWLLLDTIHHHTGVKLPSFDFSTLPHRRRAFETFVEYHYRYYQAYGNALIALLVSTLIDWRAMTAFTPLPIISGLCLLLIAAVFFFASRDALQKYYDRSSNLLGRQKIVATEKPQSKPTDLSNLPNRQS